MTGAELTNKRLRLGLTREGLASELGFTPKYVYMLERGRKPIQTTTQHAVWCLMYQAKVAKIGERK